MSNKSGGIFGKLVFWAIVVLLLWAGWGVWRDYQKHNNFESQRAAEVAVAQWLSIPPVIGDIIGLLNNQADKTVPDVPGKDTPAQSDLPQSTSISAPATAPDPTPAPVPTSTVTATNVPPPATPMPTATPVDQQTRGRYLVRDTDAGGVVVLTKLQFVEFLNTRKLPESAAPAFPVVPEVTPLPTAIRPVPTAMHTTPASTRVPDVNRELPANSTLPVQELAYLMHQLVNEEREQRGLGVLAYAPEVAAIAQAHSEDMAALDYFSHTNPAGESPTDRGVRQGYDCIKDYGSYYAYGLAENIYQGWLYSSIAYIGTAAIKDWFSVEEMAENVVQGWMNSPGHRANILKGSYDREGIGVAVSSGGKVYFTQNFC